VRGVGEGVGIGGAVVGEATGTVGLDVAVRKGVRWPLLSTFTSGVSCGGAVELAEHPARRRLIANRAADHKTRPDNEFLDDIVPIIPFFDFANFHFAATRLAVTVCLC